MNEEKDVAPQKLENLKLPDKEDDPPEEEGDDSVLEIEKLPEKEAVEESDDGEAD